VPRRSVAVVVLGQHVQLSFDEAAAAAVIEANFAAHVVDSVASHPALTFEIRRLRSGYSLGCNGQPAICASDAGELLYEVEKGICVALQTLRPDLFFLHAAALERNGNAYLLAGESGHGKSTTAWGLLHQGYRYLSDELSPIDPDTLSVYPYSHALCLKRRPPGAYPLADIDAMDLGRTIHVPVDRLPSQAACAPARLAGMMFVRYRPQAHGPSMRRLSAAEAGARTYACALNALAHSHHGVDAALALSERVPCWYVEAGELRSTCALIDGVLRECESAGSRRKRATT
jgi:hypothetical protein